ncbi:MAG: hypothetical protein ACRECH_05520 [Nitrososphaerales archaeon]
MHFSSTSVTLLCEHLEVSEFGTYSVAVGERAETMMLQKCMSCNAYLTLDSKQIFPDQILEKINGSKINMRTVTAQINGALYEKLQDLMRHETEGSDASKIMTEIVALGIAQYRKTLGQ